MKCGNCFTTLKHKDGYYECPKCGWIILDDEVEDFDLDEYRLSVTHNATLEEEPASCVACGGEYPLCADSCPLFN